jgi:hypothetical protein
MRFEGSRVVLEGLTGMEKRLEALASPKIRDRIVKAGLGSALNIVRTGIKREAPNRTGFLRGGIGRKVMKGRAPGAWIAKAGVRVGKVKNDVRTGHLVALGTGERHRESLGGKFSFIKNPTEDQLSTGSMPANSFVQRGYSKTIGRAMATLERRVEKKLASELAKLNK